MTFKPLYFTFFFITFITSCKSPETVSKNYSESLANGECEPLILMTIGEARSTMVNYDCKPYDAVIVSDVGCEIGKETATCIYSENRSYYNLDAEVETTLKLVRIDRDWKVSLENKEIINITGGNNPELVAEIFIRLLSEGNCEIAQMLTVSSAKNRLRDQIEDKCNAFHLEVLSSKCEINNNSAIYYTTEKRNSGIEIKYIYKLVKVGEEWRIIDYKRDSSSSPESATHVFVSLLSEGNCKEALGLTISNASESVEASIASGCEGYESEIIGDVTCVIENDHATCSCVEKRDILGELTFNYELENVDGEWKISSYAKDMDGLDYGGE